MTTTGADLYGLLGVEPTASPLEIGRAFRRLAAELHPDRRPGDPTAAARFAAVSSAYEILRDPDRRAAYDQSRRSVVGRSIPVNFVDREERTAGSHWPLTGPFGGSAFPGGEGLWASPRNGWVVRTPRSTNSAKMIELEVELPDAIFGTETSLPTAAGGQTRVRIPQGVRDGQILRIPGTGSGEIHVKVRVAPHPHYHRRGDALETTVTVSFTEAALGAEVPLPAFRGTPRTALVPPGTRSGTVIRVPTGAHPGVRLGDLLVRVLIDVPQTASPKLRAALKDIGRLLPDPRHPD